MTRKRNAAPRVRIESDGDELYFVFNGKRIAKCGHPGTPQARTWISLDPCYVVDTTGTEAIVYERE